MLKNKSFILTPKSYFLLSLRLLNFGGIFHGK